MINSRGEFGQDYFTLNSTYFEGRPPKSVNMHWRRFAVSSIPVSDTTKFEAWLAERWREKDDLLEYYMENARFPEDEDESQGNGNAHATKPVSGNTSGARQRVKVGGQERRITTSGGSTATGGWGGPIETEVKLKGWWEVFDMFKVLMLVLPLSVLCYSARWPALRPTWGSANTSEVFGGTRHSSFSMN